MKLRLRYKKEGLARFISHLDLVRTFERAFRRANLPIAFTQGFSPRPKMTFAPALSVGVTSSGEYLDAEFSQDVSVDDVALKLNRALPQGIKVIDAKIANESLALSMLNGAKYVVTVDLQDVEPEKLKEGIRSLLEQDELIIEKETKSGRKLVNIAPYIYHLDLLNSDASTARIVMDIAIGQQGNVSPAAVIGELEKRLSSKLELLSIHREELFYISNDNKILPM